MSDKGVFLIIFGSTGDLMKRKIVPALLDLYKRNELGKNSIIVGVGRRAMGDMSYRQFLAENLSEKDKDMLNELPLHYCECDFTKTGELGKLASFLKVLEPAHDKHRIFYLATGYEFFAGIVDEIEKAGLASKSGKHTAIAFEKPFGHDYKSSEKLNRDIDKAFSETNIFRVDHYLAKDTIKDLVSQRIADVDFEHLLHRDHVSKIQIIADEELGVGNRIAYYDSSGALKDMVQNHLLQVLSLVIMDLPRKEGNDELHNCKVKALEQLYLGNNEEQLLGQYKSYSKEANESKLKPSKTETFARITLYSNNKRWSGVPIVIRTGKKLARKYGEIVIDLKDGESLVIPIMSENNEYASVFNSLINGDHSLFPRFDEVQTSWKLVEEMQKRKAKYNFVIYADGSEPEVK